MKPTRGSLMYLALLLVFAFLLSACERPLSNGEGEATDEATATSSSTVTEDSNAGEATEDTSADESEIEEPDTGGQMSDSESTSEEESASDVDSDSDGDTDSDEDSDSDGDTDPDGDTDSDEDSDSDEDADSDEDMDSDEDADEVEMEESGAADGNGDEGADDGESADASDEDVGGGAPDTSEDGTAAESEESSEAETGTGGTAEVEEGETSEEASAETGGGEADSGAMAAIPATHTVAAGENLYRIGLKYGLSWVTLARYNNLPNANSIYVGQVLQIPGGQDPAPPTQPPTGNVYVVQSGDTLSSIGLAYGVSWVEIAEANGIVNPNQIYPGQELKIPTSAPGPTPQFTHLVQPGQTLFRISLQYGVPWPAIAEANNISSPYVIYAGQTLVIPGG